MWSNLKRPGNWAQMASSSAYLTRLQTDLYKERHGLDSLSKTFQSSIEHAPGHVYNRITTFPDR